MWILKQKTTFSDSHYFNFPTSGFASGCNLNDIISSTDPFYDLFNFSPTEDVSIIKPSVEKTFIPNNDNPYYIDFDYYYYYYYYYESSDQKMMNDDDSSISNSKKLYTIKVI